VIFAADIKQMGLRGIALLTGRFIRIVAAELKVVPAIVAVES
jgi:hypothetical protein